jgi:uncharacterized protein YlaI
MANQGKCPKCETVITDVIGEDITISKKLRGFTYQCPKCNTILGVQMNSLALNKDLETNIVKAIKTPKA